MHLSSLLLIISLGLLVGCASSTQNKPTDATADAQTDTVSQPLPASAPGSARVTATVREYREEKDGYVCTLQIEAVQRYGAGTPPLPVGSEVEVFMRPILFGDDPDGVKAAERLQAGQTLDVMLRHQQAAAGGASTLSWEAVQLY